MFMKPDNMCMDIFTGHNVPITIVLRALNILILNLHNKLYRIDNITIPIFIREENRVKLLTLHHTVKYW